MPKNKYRNRKRDRRLGDIKYDKDGKQVDDRDTDQGKQMGFKDIIRENKVFEHFYRTQGFCSSEEEFSSFMAVFATDLPASFRITGTRSHAAALLKIIDGQFFSELSARAQVEGESVAVPKVLPWYPDKLAYQLNVTRKDIRRMEVYWKLHNFLVACTDTGAISRQETVSMIPPLVLGVEPHHKVLDMCAAPGSKTTQLIEALHEAAPGVIPSGLVVANDQDSSRCCMLTTQVKRLQSPCLMITNHDAAFMPNFLVPRETSPDETEEPSTLGESENSTTSPALVPLKFDRILCDVPCTGDGTLRKNADIWPKWNPVNSVNLHGIQYRIAKRGLELLEVGGKLAYSTCSLNPIEDEAVLARLLQETGDSVRLVEIRDKLPGLICSPGLQTWVCASKEGEIYHKIEEVPEKIAKTQIRPYMFPPVDPEVRAGLHLERCARILPHQQNTGGFFVALLEKVAQCPWTSKRNKEGNNKTWEDRDSTGTEEPPRKKQKGGGQWCKFREDPITYFEEGDDLYSEIQEYYSLSLPCRNFLTRSKNEESNKKNLYFTNDIVRDIIVNNADKIKVINTGVKAFVKAENKGSRCDYRIAQEGALATIPLLKARLVHPTKPDLLTILKAAEIDKPPEIVLFTDPAFKAELEMLDTGSIGYVFKDEDTGMVIEMVGWKGKNTVRAYVVKSERLHYLRLLGEEIPEELQINKFEKKNKEDDKSEIGNGDVQKIEEEETMNDR